MMDNPRENSLTLVPAKGLMRPGVVIPKQSIGFLIRDHLACDILPAGSHTLKKGDHVLVAPEQAWPIEVASVGGFQVVASIAMLRATFHGTDCYEHFFKDHPARGQAKQPAIVVQVHEFVADLITSRSQRIEDCESELRRLLIPVGLDLVSLKTTPITVVSDAAPPVDNDGSTNLSLATEEATPVNTTAKTLTVEDAAEQSLHIRLGVHPEMRRSWWRKEGIGAFEGRLFNAAKRHLQCLKRDLSQARSQPSTVPRANIQLTWDLCDALLARLAAQRPEDLVIHGGNRAALVNEAKQILSICEQLATCSVTNAERLEVINQGLEELRRALDRRSSSLTGLTATTP